MAETKKPVWVVAGTSAFSGHEPPTFGPFETEEKAREFADSYPGRHVFDDVVNRASPCGPWYP